MFIPVVGLVCIVWSICYMVYRSKLDIENFEITLFGIFKVKIKTKKEKSK